MTKYICPECGTECANAPGIGHYCPKYDCPVNDRAIRVEK